MPFIDHGHKDTTHTPLSIPNRSLCLILLLPFSSDSLLFPIPSLDFILLGSPFIRSLFIGLFGGPHPQGSGYHSACYGGLFFGSRSFAAVVIGVG